MAGCRGLQRSLLQVVWGCRAPFAQDIYRARDLVGNRVVGDTCDRFCFQSMVQECHGLRHFQMRANWTRRMSPFCNRRRAHIESVARAELE